MKTYLIKMCILGLLMTSAWGVKAQKNIVISDSLAANAEMLDVKLKAQWQGEKRKWVFGDYAVVESKIGGTKYRKKENIFSTKEVRKSAKKFSFVMSNKEHDSAIVEAVHNTMVQSEEEMMLGVIHMGYEDIVAESDIFSATIATTGDTSQLWTLFLGSHEGTGSESNYGTYLTNGKRKIILSPSGSNIYFTDQQSFIMYAPLPAMGFEFMENEQSLCAVQYSSSGFGKPKNLVWIHKSIDKNMKLILAAAMTAILIEYSPLSPVH